MPDDLIDDGAWLDPEFLVHAGPDVVPGGPRTDAASSPAVRRARAFYRESSHLHRRAAPVVRRQLLALDAARFGDRELAGRIGSVPVAGEPDALWTVAWATSSMIVLTYRDALPGHTDTVHSVALGTAEGRDVLVTAGWDRTVHVRDLADGRPLGDPRPGGTAEAATGGRPAVALVGRPPADLPVDAALADRLASAWTVAPGVLDGRPVLAVADGEGPVRVWDPVTGRPVGEPFTGHTEPVRVVATGTVDGRPVAVTGGLDTTARVWDLATGRPLGEPLTGHTGAVWAVAAGELDGRAVAVTGSSDRTVRVWDLTTGQPHGPALAFPAEVGAVALAPDGRLAVGFGWEAAVLTHRRPAGSR